MKVIIEDKDFNRMKIADVESFTDEDLKATLEELVDGKDNITYAVRKLIHVNYREVDSIYDDRSLEIPFKYFDVFPERPGCSVLKETKPSQRIRKLSIDSFLAYLSSIQRLNGFQLRNIEYERFLRDQTITLVFYGSPPDAKKSQQCGYEITCKSRMPLKKYIFGSEKI